MKCPFCRTTNTDVYNTRPTKFDTQIWRRRRCNICQNTFTTYESPDLRFLRVTNSANHKPQHYNRARLVMSLYEAFQPTLRSNDSSDTLDGILATIEAKLLDLQRPTLATQDIAQITLVTLKHFDATAFVRYLTVHTHLASPAQLKKALRDY